MKKQVKKVQKTEEKISRTKKLVTKSVPPVESPPKTLDWFKQKLAEERDSIFFNQKSTRERYQVQQEVMSDEVDMASADTDQNMLLRLNNRETLYLKKINLALRRIHDGNFGECESCGGEIEPKRLEARPTVSLCVACKEEQERSEQVSIVGRGHKSLGDSFYKRIGH